MSGVPAADWQTMCIGDLLRARHITAHTGFAQGAFNESGEGVVHLRPYNVSPDGVIDLTQAKFVAAPPKSGLWVHRGDVIFNNTNSEDLVGKTAYFVQEGRFTASNHMTIIHVIDPNVVDAEWLARTLHYRWMRGDFKALCRRYVGQASIGLERLSRIDLDMPPATEQRAIARALQAIEDAKAARQREIALERECKAALMQYLFTHGTRNEPTKQTEIGEMPEGWAVARLREVARIASGGTPDRGRPEYWGGNIPWVKTGEIKYNVIRETEESITPEGLQGSAARMIPAGAVIMAMYGQGITRGRVAILGIDATLNQACAAIMLSPSLVPEFVFYYLTYRYEAIRSLAHGANQKNLNSLLVGSILVPVVTREEQDEIVSALGACDAKIAALEREATLLDELFRAMLEQLMTGRLSALPLIDQALMSVSSQS